MIHDKSLWQKINFDFRAPIWKRPKSQKYTYPNAQKIHIQCSWTTVQIDNESLENLYWLKLGFVIMIVGYIYSQKCNENAKLNWVVTF